MLTCGCLAGGMGQEPGGVHQARVKGSGTLTKQSQHTAKRRSVSTGVTSFGGCYLYFINNVIILVRAGE